MFLKLQLIVPELRPLFGEPTPKPRRITLKVGATLARLPADRQCEFWQKVRMEPTQDRMVKMLQQIGVGIFVPKRQRGPAKPVNV